ncbi:MAG: hypothetical protein ACXVKI_17340 [Flavisolibacter sp.]
MKSKYILHFSVMLLCLFSFICHFIPAPREDHSHNLGHPWEEFEPSYYSKFQTVQDIIVDADKKFAVKDQNSLSYFNYIAEVIRKRFYHGYSCYSLSDNPFAFLAGKFIWNNLSAIVIPDDIMKHPMAACSQQAIVLMQVFKRRNIDFRKVGFSNHYTVEGKIEGSWKYFDTNLEPNFNNQRASLNDLIVTHRFDSVYSNIQMNPQEFHKELSNPVLGEINKAPASKAIFFHKACYLLQSKYFLSILLLLSTVNLVGLKNIIRPTFFSRK